MEYIVWYLIGTILAIIEMLVINLLIDKCKEFRDFYGFSIYDQLPIDRILFVSLGSWIVVIISGIVILIDIIKARR